MSRKEAKRQARQESPQADYSALSTAELYALERGVTVGKLDEVLRT